MGSSRSVRGERDIDLWAGRWRRREAQGDAIICTRCEGGNILTYSETCA